MRNYESIFAPFMQRLITIKRGLGFKCIDMEYSYLMFDRFILSESVSSVGITRELAEKWSAPRANESQRTRYVRIAHVAQLCHFLCTLGYKSHIPRLPRIQRSHVPYIFSREQVAAFFAASDRIMIKCSRHETSISAVPALFRMLYSTGMRLGEALALRDVDVDLKGKTILKVPKTDETVVYRFPGRLPRYAMATVPTVSFIPAKGHQQIRFSVRTMVKPAPGDRFTTGSGGSFYRQVFPIWEGEQDLAYMTCAIHIVSIHWLQ